MQRHELASQTFHELTVLASAGSTPGDHRRARWTCRCSCGTFVVVLGQNLTNGQTRSCGCLKRRVAAELSRTHGQSHLPEYRVWIGMIARCGNPKHAKFHHYGGKGIRIYPPWRESFPRFLADMGRRPSKVHMIERRDGTRDYTPDNCYWATRVQQNNNTTRNRMLTFRGETHTLADWARIMRLPRTVVTNRLYRHWTVERALTQPCNANHSPADTNA